MYPHILTGYCEIEALVENWTNEYASLGYGTELYASLRDFCEVAGIKPILLSSGYAPSEPPPSVMGLPQALGRDGMKFEGKRSTL